MGERSEAARRRMEALLELPEPRVAGAARDLVTDLARRDPLLDLIDELITELAAGSERAAGRARRSYRHVLGFTKLLLVDDRHAGALRVHRWQPTTRAPGGEDIHNHRSPLASCVLSGTLHMDVFERCPPDGPGSASDALGVTAYRESRSEHSADWLLEHRGTARLRLVHTARYAPGASYGLPSHALHRAWCDPRQPTVTLFLETGGPCRPHTDVFTTAPSHPATVGRTALAEEDFLTELTGLAADLAG